MIEIWNLERNMTSIKYTIIREDQQVEMTKMPKEAPSLDEDTHDLYLLPRHTYCLIMHIAEIISATCSKY